MYEDSIKNIDLNSDELELLIELLENYYYSSVSEDLLVRGLIDKLIEY